LKIPGPKILGGRGSEVKVTKVTKKKMGARGGVNIQTIQRIKGGGVKDQ